ncbi:DUF2505 family protein [Streptomyces sp. NPDC002073]
MGKFTTTHELQGPASEAWALLIDDEFMGEVYRQDVGYPSWDVVERTEGTEEVTRKVAMVPKREMPAPVAKLFGSGYREVEESKFSTSARVWSWKRVPSTLADKLVQEGTVRIEEAEGGLSRLVIEIRLEAKIFGVGGLIEATYEKAYRSEADTIAASLSKRLAAGKV